ncbi:MAG: type III-A CRISPR-associated protein Csm2 [Deltaproteobacteria bacterium]|nr:type III-A CRISPR-associated protein Csm2 [Deltaproteobacteria bacterium]
MPSDHEWRLGGPPNRGQPQQESVRDRQENPRAEDIAAVLSGDATRIDEIAERLGKRLAERKLNRTQIRNFYGPITIVRAEDNPDKRKKALRMHRSRLAYLVARADRGAADDLWDLFGELLKRAEGKTQIDAVCDLAEAVVAYHRYHDKRRETDEQSRGAKGQANF